MATDVDVMPRTLPGRRGYRPLQPERPLLIQIRVTTDEKARALDLARQSGYETVSSFVRDRMLGDSKPAA